MSFLITSSEIVQEESSACNSKFGYDQECACCVAIRCLRLTVVVVRKTVFGLAEAPALAILDEYDGLFGIIFMKDERIEIISLEDFIKLKNKDSDEEEFEIEDVEFE